MEQDRYVLDMSASLENMMHKKIDIHCHTTRSKLKDIVPQSASLEEIEKQMKIHNVEYTVVLASYFPRQGSGISNFRLLHWLNNKPFFKLFGSLDFQNYFATGLKELTELAENGHLYGIKVYSGYQEIDFRSPQFKQLGLLAESYQLPLMFHGGFIQCHESDVNRAISPGQFSTVAQQFPLVPIIISHLAWPFVWELIELVRNHDNIYADMSGMMDSFKTAHTLSDCVQGLKQFLDKCGPQRLLFGTDFPVQTHADSVKLIELAMAHFSNFDKHCVYYQNAKKLLRFE